MRRREREWDVDIYALENSACDSTGSFNLFNVPSPLFYYRRASLSSRRTVVFLNFKIACDEMI